ncbi:hypothetical protein BDI4_190065 [Burkholderia diffusa]|nr:hypothetical protein BDI4_190065 [Burkholderia diffusa]
MWELPGYLRCGMHLGRFSYSDRAALH